VLDKSLAHRKYWSFNAVCSKPKARSESVGPSFGATSQFCDTGWKSV